MSDKGFKGPKVSGCKGFPPCGTPKIGARVQEFEELHVYQQARDLTNQIYEITRQGSFSKDYGLANQIRRASVSIMSNLAEGFERGTNTEFIQFLFIAKGSCGEVRAQLAIAFDQKYLEEDTYQSLVDQCRRISGMLSNLITYLKSSKFKGSKFKKPSFKSMAQEVNEILEKIRSQSGEK